MNFELSATNISQNAGADPEGPTIFRSLTIQIPGPGLHVIMGPSGQGKSTLLKTLGGVWEPQTGNISLGGQPLWDPLIPHTLNKKILPRMGFAFQNNALFKSLRVIDNLTFPYECRYPNQPKAERIKLATSWLEQLGLSAVAQQLPDELSGGMQKRLGLARCLMLNPEFIFLDDPTAGLDPLTSREIAALLGKMLSKIQALVIVVTNDPDRAADWGPAIHYFDQGNIRSPGDSQYALTRERFL